MGQAGKAGPAATPNFPQHPRLPAILPALFQTPQPRSGHALMAGSVELREIGGPLPGPSTHQEPLRGLPMGLCPCLPLWMEKGTSCHPREPTAEPRGVHGACLHAPPPPHILSAPTPVHPLVSLSYLFLSCPHPSLFLSVLLLPFTLFVSPLSVLPPSLSTHLSLCVSLSLPLSLSPSLSLTPAPSPAPPLFLPVSRSSGSSCCILQLPPLSPEDNAQCRLRPACGDDPGHLGHKLPAKLSSGV